MTTFTTWDETWMAVAIAVSRRSKCSRDQVGAVVVSTDQRVIGTGYNGQPSGFSETCETCPRRLKVGTGLDDFYSDCTSIHAEANALLFSDSTRRKGGTLYVTRAPCWGCSKLIANSGIEDLVLPSPLLDEKIRAYLIASGIRLDYCY